VNQNKNVLWIALIGVAVVLLVAFLLAKKPGEGGFSSPIAPSPAEPFPKDTPPLAPAVPVLPPENAAPVTPLETVPGPGTTQGDAALPGASPAPPEVPAPSGPTPSQPDIPER
jgi:hypothetical protein